jgi:DNA polymerase III delta subunit
MLQCYFGTDTVMVRQKALEAARSCGGTLTILSADEYQPGSVGQAVGSASLFGDRTTYLLDTPSADAQFQEEVTALLAALAAAPDTFLIIEGKLLAAEVRAYQKVAVLMQEYSSATTTRFNNFLLSDALAARDKKSLWLCLWQARHAGLSNEELIGTLWWQLKTIALVQQTHSAEEAQMKAYPYQKARQAATRYTAEEVARLMEQLISIYHQGHLGEVELDLALEQWVLTV